MLSLTSMTESPKVASTTLQVSLLMVQKAALTASILHYSLAVQKT